MKINKKRPGMADQKILDWEKICLNMFANKSYFGDFETRVSNENLVMQQKTRPIISSFRNFAKKLFSAEIKVLANIFELPFLPSIHPFVCSIYFSVHNFCLSMQPTNQARKEEGSIHFGKFTSVEYP